VSIIEKLFFTSSLLVASSVAFSQGEVQLVINPGVSLADGVASQAEKITSWHLDDLSTEHNPMNLSYTNFGSGDIYYALYSDMQIRSFNLATKQYLGGWGLVRWVDEAVEPEMQWLIRDKPYVTYNDGEWLGCVQQHPLRYTDLDKDKKQELFLLLNSDNVSDAVVFSVELHKVIFASVLAAQDAFSEAEIQPDHLLEIFPRWDNNPIYPQYPAYEASARKNSNIENGKKTFAKLYFNDFDADGAFDIVVWRKLYESRLNSDPVKGFVKKGDLLVHYKLVNGEYKKQETNQATIKGWLTAKQLTWQKGYPNKSECPGQEGQLIPEMHDTLLNDPDVLR